MESSLKRAADLKQALLDFVLDADGELATALESFSAEQLSGAQQQGMNSRDLVIHRFLTEGVVGTSTPIDLFLQDQEGLELSTSDRALVLSWKSSFVGLFAITHVSEDGVDVRNWMTDKLYTVKSSDPDELAKLSRLKAGEMLLTQIAPFQAETWLFFSSYISLGKLGKPKLAIAIGNFKKAHKKHLYGDAPELLEEAWKSVEKYHDEFVEFFGAAEVTLSGYHLGKKLKEFQEIALQKRLESLSIDPDQSLGDLADEAGLSEAEIATAAADAGIDAKAVSDVLSNPGKAKMAAPQVELPAHLKNAEQVTVMTHPRWGQLFLANHAQLKAQLAQLDEADEADEASEASEADKEANADLSKQAIAAKLVRRYLDDPEINTFVWHQLAQQYPAPLERLIREVCDRPNFVLSTDLDSLLAESNKPLAPELPEIASVPMHLHNLFQEAVLEVHKDKSKSKAPAKQSFGFKKKA